MVDIEVVIQELENAANEAVADVQNEVNEKQRLEEENKRLAVCIIIDWIWKYLNNSFFYCCKKLEYYRNKHSIYYRKKEQC